MAEYEINGTISTNEHTQRGNWTNPDAEMKVAEAYSKYVDAAIQRQKVNDVAGWVCVGACFGIPLIMIGVGAAYSAISETRRKNQKAKEV